jgi:EAL domain-containing protein (putative c-di-GMP-specific phosphodiesterase class I)
MMGKPMADSLGFEGQIAMGDPLSSAVSLRDRETLAMVDQALHARQVMLAFQPVVLSGDPQRIAFHEALIRIRDETGRIIPARDFMDAVETRELGRRIDCAALELGLAELIAHPGLRLSVNMSARSIGYARWMQVLGEGLARDPTAGERLILEITESSAMLMPDIVSAFMEDLHRRNVSFALDDFGAGYTSFRYLREFYFDILKIDGQFIRGIARDPDNQALTRALVSVGQHFDMLTVAESVETLEDATWLVENGLDCLQGYYFAAPTIKPNWRQAGRRTG